MQLRKKKQVFFTFLEKLAGFFADLENSKMKCIKNIKNRSKIWRNLSLYREINPILRSILQYMYNIPGKYMHFMNMFTQSS